MKPKRKSTWLRNRGYLHFTNQINVSEKRGEILGFVKNKEAVAKHAFFPLIHTNIKVRRYKFDKPGTARAHSHNGEQTYKLRPLHYATHIDAMIFGYYGERLQLKYLDELKKTEGLTDCVTAYIQIAHPVRKGKNKGTIDFAHEVFKEIESRSEQGCWALKYDIEKFFSNMNHRVLKNAWAKLLDNTTLPTDHYSVFKAATKFSFIYRDDLRLKSHDFNRRAGFDERYLAEIRKTNVSAFFYDPVDFRNTLKEGKLKVHKNNFRNKQGEMVGIPQGLPISATLANLYLLSFDKIMLDEVVVKRQGFYRRYSDDIIIVCSEEHKKAIMELVDNTLEDIELNVSPGKNEEYFFSNKDVRGVSKLTSQLWQNGRFFDNRPLTYLGFEFYGNKTLIKSANLSKFYRRMILAVKSRTKRAYASAYGNQTINTALFNRRLYRLYTNIDLDKKSITRNFKSLVPNQFGDYVYRVQKNEGEFRSNYFKYGERASEIMGTNSIVKQTRRHRTIFKQAVQKYAKIYSQRYKF
ncbi:reverse transcriptase domain-containing protein [Mucilaginibacter gossypii]|uniref:Reverse transcriptase (RNA-dependent DNA polymerase) n=2 Tax=Mucilaginibacter TaxID=423349 RepID=A0A1G7VGV7_9SPHI|nr:reverse transcriptase domain-containing protein [Mucilaginibacter gossypii]SDG59066.1 Reverse transcriptase (RNA-dependent DNA polymerase) [Mucilaginibacter gossypii]